VVSFGWVGSLGCLRAGFFVGVGGTSGCLLLLLFSQVRFGSEREEQCRQRNARHRWEMDCLGKFTLLEDEEKTPERKGGGLVCLWWREWI